jgi:hypothetical protein
MTCPTFKLLVAPFASETWTVGITAGVAVAVGVGLAVVVFVGVGVGAAVGVTVAVAGVDVPVGGAVVGAGMITGPGLDLEQAARTARRPRTATLPPLAAKRCHVTIRAALLSSGRACRAG